MIWSKYRENERIFMDLVHSAGFASKAPIPGWWPDVALLALHCGCFYVNGCKCLHSIHFHTCNVARPCPEVSGWSVGSRRATGRTPDADRRADIVFPADEGLRATAICVAIPPHSQTRRAINSSDLRCLLICVLRIKSTNTVCFREAEQTVSRW